MKVLAGLAVLFLALPAWAAPDATLKGGLGSPLLPNNLAGKDKAFLAAIILDGRPGTAMPPWRGMLSDEDVDWIVDYLKRGTK